MCGSQWRIEQNPAGFFHIPSPVLNSESDWLCPSNPEQTNPDVHSVFQRLIIMFILGNT